MREIVRRALLLVGLLGAITAFMATAPALLRVHAVDWVHEKERWPRFLYADMSLEEYIASKTADRLIEVRGPQWQAFFAATQAAGSGGPEDASWRKRLGRSFYDDNVYFRLDEAPLAIVASGLNEGQPFTYLSLERGGSLEYLALTYELPRDAVHGAPLWLLYPYRLASPFWLFAGVLAYVLIPRRKPPVDAVQYSGEGSLLLTDMVGCVLVGAFFALPMFVITANASSPRVLEFGAGWGYLTLVSWVLAVGCGSILFVAAWHRTFYIEILPGGLRVHNWRGEREYPFRDMIAVGVAEFRMPRVLVVLGAIVSLFRWRALGPTLMLAGSYDRGLEIILHGTRTLRLRVSQTRGVGRLLEALKGADIVVAPEAEQLFAPGRPGRGRRKAS